MPSGSGVGCSVVFELVTEFLGEVSLLAQNLSVYQPGGAGKAARIQPEAPARPTPRYRAPSDVHRVAAHRVRAGGHRPVGMASVAF